MPSSKDYLLYVLEQTSNLNITYKRMMGEYLIYLDNILIGGIYDDRLLVKENDNNHKYQMEEVIPYPNAKKMYLVSEIDNRLLLEQILLDTLNGQI